MSKMLISSCYITDAPCNFFRVFIEFLQKYLIQLGENSWVLTSYAGGSFIPKKSLLSGFNSSISTIFLYSSDVPFFSVASFLFLKISKIKEICQLKRTFQMSCCEHVEHISPFHFSSMYYELKPSVRNNCFNGSKQFFGIPRL